jgi:hypothetical protein
MATRKEMELRLGNSNHIRPFTTMDEGREWVGVLHLGNRIESQSNYIRPFMTKGEGRQWMGVLREWEWNHI